MKTINKILQFLHLKKYQLPPIQHPHWAQVNYYAEDPLFILDFSSCNALTSIDFSLITILSGTTTLVETKKDQRIGRRIFSEIDPFGEEIWYDD